MMFWTEEHEKLFKELQSLRIKRGAKPWQEEELLEVAHSEIHHLRAAKAAWENCCVDAQRCMGTMSKPYKPEEKDAWEDQVTTEWEIFLASKKKAVILG